MLRFISSLEVRLPRKLRFLPKISNPRKVRYPAKGFRVIVAVAGLLLSLSLPGQVPAVDSMGANMGKQHWKRALYWALQAAEALPGEKYWRYMNAAEFASRDGDASLAFHYLMQVVGSDIVTQAYFESTAFTWLHSDPRWHTLMEKVQEAHAQVRRQQLRVAQGFRKRQDSLLQAARTAFASIHEASSPEVLYQQLRQKRHAAASAPPGRFAGGWWSLNDTVEVPYLLQFPPAYDPAKSYPLLVVLHGAVLQNAAFPEVADSVHVAFFGNAFLHQASQQGMIVVAPYSTRQYNWMVPEAGFPIVPGIVRQVKQLYSLDDARVYLVGHSNGATGAFSYLLKAPGPFAGFAGVNNRPQVRTGGTFLKNAVNRSFYTVATDHDYYFPLPGHRTLDSLARGLGIRWQHREVLGARTHGYLISSSDSTTRQVYQDLFAQLLTVQRNPFQKRLYWECDDERYGRCDWLQITRLDTSASPADWHQMVNFPVSGWRQAEDPTRVTDSTSLAFSFPRRSGAVIATFHRNRFHLRTSRVKAVNLYIAPQMVNLRRPVRVRINGKRVFKGRLLMNKPFMVQNFGQEYDRQAVWVNSLSFRVEE
jgi:predicted peptidase